MKLYTLLNSSGLIQKKKIMAHIAQIGHEILLLYVRQSIISINAYTRGCMSCTN